jgi:hypothetical protein
MQVTVSFKVCDKGVLITEHTGLFSSTHLVKDRVSVTYSASAFRWNDIMSASGMVA